MIVIGGTYDEVCFEPKWNYKFGSGLRAISTLYSLDLNREIEFFTYGNSDTKFYLESMFFNNFHLTVFDFPGPIRFMYDFPLSIPRIFPRLDIISEN